MLQLLSCRDSWQRMARGFLKMKNAREDSCLSLFEEAERRLLAAVCPAYCYRLFPLCFLPEGLRLQGSALVLEGLSLKAHLQNSSHGVLLCVSLGEGADRVIRQAQAEDMALAAVADALASAMAECACDLAEQEILQALPYEKPTSRFSPGYGDLSLSAQEPLLNVLDARRRVGVTVSPGGLLLPRKSVTAVIGVKESTCWRKE